MRRFSESLMSLTIRDGIYFPTGYSGAGNSDYKERWEQEAREDHIKSAIASTSGDGDEFTMLTGKISQIWADFPANIHYETILDIGCGYGRLPLYLSKVKNVSCKTYYGIDISESMLRHLLRYKERYDFFPSAEIRLFCTSADEIPLDDNSVDFVLSSAVFLHMGKEYVKKTLSEVARVLKTSGNFIFESSFPNKVCFANSLVYLKSILPVERNPNYMKFYSKNEIKRLLRSSKLANKIPRYTIETASYGLIPTQLGVNNVLPAKRINKRISSPPRWLEPILSMSYTVHGSGS